MKRDTTLFCLTHGLTEEAGRVVEKEPMKAKELLKLLTKSNAYGLEKFRKLITF